MRKANVRSAWPGHASSQPAMTQVRIGPSFWSLRLSARFVNYECFSCDCDFEKSVDPCSVSYSHNCLYDTWGHFRISKGNIVWILFRCSMASLKNSLVQLANTDFLVDIAGGRRTPCFDDYL